MGVSFKVSKVGKRYVPKPIAGQPECSTSESSKESFLNKLESNKKPDIIEAPNSFAAHKLSALTEHDVSIILNLLPRGYFVEKPSEVENFQPLLQDMKSLHPYDRASKSIFSAIETGWLPGDLLNDIPCKYINGNVICEIRDYRKCTSEQGTAAPTDAVPVINRIRLRMSMENVVKDIPLIADDSWTYSDLMEVESRILKALQPKLDLCPVPRFDRICADTSIIKLDIDVGRKKRLRPTPEVTVTSNHTHGKKICIDGIPENANNSGESGAVLSSIAMQHAYGSATAQQLPSVISSSQPNNSLQEGARPTLPVTGHSKFQSTVNHPGILQDQGLSTANYVGVNAGISLPQNMMSLYTDTANANVPLHGRREAQDPHLTSMPGLKRPRQTAAGLDGIPTHQISPPLAGFNASDMQWKNQTVHPPIDAKGFQHSNGVPRFPQMKQEVGTSIYFNQQAMRYGPKEEQIDSDKLDKQDLERSKDSLQPMVATDNALDQHQLTAQHQAQQSSMRGHLPPLTQWNNLRLSVDKDVRKDDMLPKRKTLPSPRVSSGPMVQSPVSSKSGEISSGSIGGQYNAMTATSALNSQLDKIMPNSSAVVGAPSVASSPSDSVHRQSQASASLKRKANSVPKIQAMSGIGSPASVSNFNTPLNANSPSIGTSPTVDQALIDKFMKIEMISQRYQLNARKNKAENYPAKKLMSYSSQQVALSLSDSLNSDDFTDLVQPLSRSIRCGNINTCKSRVLTFISPERFYQVVPGRSPSRLILIEKPFDGTVAMQYGDTDDSDLLSSPDCWQTLPTTNHADLLAAQFCALMDRDGHHKAEDQVFQAPTPAIRIGVASGGPPVVSGISSEAAASEGRHANLAPPLLSNAGVPSNSSGMGPMSSQGLSNNARMQTAGSGTPTLPTSQGYFPGPGISARNQHLEQPLLQQQQQQLQQLQSPQSQLQQHQQQLPLSQIQRSSSLITNNPLSHLIGQNSNIQMGSNPIVNNKSAHLQLQMLQQHQQQHQQQQHQQQHNQIPRKVMMGLGAAMGMGNMGNNMVGLAGIGNVIGMGGVRGLSSPMGALPGLGNVNPNQLLPTSASSFGTGIRPTSMSPAQAAAAAAMATKMRLAQQNRVGMYGTQPGIANMAGSSNQMLPTTAGVSMLNHALTRANISSMQPSAAMASMGPPKLSGPNFYLNQQQLQLQQHQQRLQQQQQHLQQQSPQMQQHQQISSPLQQPQVGSPSVAGSPSPMVAQQQQPQISPQQIGQQTPLSPQQFNSGALQQINNGSMGVAPPPASPQLSSQTHGSVGSISSSPMEQLQGANKGGSSNA